MELVVRSDKVARIRAMPFLCLAVLAFYVMTGHGIFDGLSRIFSFVGIALIGIAAVSAKMAVETAMRHSQEAAEWVWQRIPDEADADLFVSIYGERTAGDVFAPWIKQTGHIRKAIKKRKRKKRGFMR